MNRNEILFEKMLIGALFGCSLLVASSGAGAFEGMVCEPRYLEMDYARPPDAPPACPPSARVTRSYTLCAPSSLIAGKKPAPLVLAFHGAGDSSSATAFQNRVQFEARGVAEEFVTVYPNGCRLVNRQLICDGGNWNAQGDPPRGVSERCKVDDMGFIDEVMKDLTVNLNYKFSKIAAFGHSKGGIFAYSLACDRGKDIAAIGVTAATLSRPPSTCSRPDNGISEGVSILHAHNLQDPSVPFEGGGIEFDWPSAKEGVQFWATANNKCVLPIDGHDFTRQMCVEAACQTQVKMELCLVDVVGGNPAQDPIIAHRYNTYDAAFVAGNAEHSNIRDAFIERFLKEQIKK